MMTLLHLQCRPLSLLVFFCLLFHPTLSIDTPSPSPSPLSADSDISTPPSPSPSPISDISSPPSQPPSSDSETASPPTPSPSPAASDIPPSDAPSSPSPSPSPDAADESAQMESHAQTGDSPASSSKMNGGHKAGVAFGVIGAACVVGAAGWIYKKRQDNIRRTQYGYNTRTTMI